MKLSSFEPRSQIVPIFFNVETSVGRNGQNSSMEDIMLVQLLLTLNGERVPAGSAEAEKAHVLMRSISISGVVDQATIDGIVAFQESMRRSGFPSFPVDGRVNVAHSYSYGPVPYTIFLMNGFVRRHSPK